ncbi:fumarylacetoacetate hydrolase family protein [Methanococcoides burtonii]|uniref:Fumarylacetoacetate hydrolase domain-containing protein n=1 Tax=Methanococcoides burtonii (strain DSM 6242 / NBRC 107633 / OCM 468 / ACE-M) TaxID=259564 RepID=Q12TN9_METBU|nr:fumarylacetoacetate hydrolase family protein [Methanococcoides burtonii]ABE53187.1 Fumarylacetoacetate hydrolase domain-containing protein [Methanococcoides burtonii DSM 6242]
MMGRFKHDEYIFYGELSIDGNLVTSLSHDGGTFEMSELALLPPAKPSKIVCIGLNYIDHAVELGMDVPVEPVIFMKPPSSVIGSGDKIVYPAMSQRVDYEAELAVVIGKRCRNIDYEDAGDVIAGYTCFNDVTARDLQQKDGQWTRAKSFDTFAPLGPFIVPEGDFDPSDVSIKCRVNGEVRQDSSTSNLIFDIPHLIEFISDIMTLEVGDVISTGTPPGVGELLRGDVVEVEVEGIGTLANEVI